MPVTLRPSAERGHFDHGWLDTRHTFSFADYQDPRHVRFRSLRVINEDVVQPGAGFPTHGHRDMEIITYIIRGALAHTDSTGASETLRRGELQRMTAGSGIRHSEYNASTEELVHLLQIWILPERTGLTPGYEQRAFPLEERRNRLAPLASRDGRGGSLILHQDAEMHGAVMDAGTRLSHPLRPGRGAWLQVVAGRLTANGQPLAAGDGAAIEDDAEVILAAETECELVLFDLGA